MNLSATGIIWDACSLINLMATNQMLSILSVLNTPSFVVREVLEKETLYLRSLDKDDKSLSPVDLTSFIEGGHLQVVDLTATERQGFVQWATMMDDGESYCVAVAQERGFCVATDDLSTINKVSVYASEIKIITTPEWLKLWGDTNENEAVLQEAKHRIEVCARYRPRKQHFLYTWWSGLKSKES